MKYFATAILLATAFAVKLRDEGEELVTVDGALDQYEADLADLALVDEEDLGLTDDLDLGSDDGSDDDKSDDGSDDDKSDDGASDDDKSDDGASEEGEDDLELA